MDEIKTWTKPATIASVEDFVMTRYAPSEGDTFYQQWGYEQWLIRTQKQNFKSLCILSEADYQKYHLAQFLQGFDSMEAALKGRPLVRATHIIKRFLQTSVAVGHLGVAFAESDTKVLVLFLRGNMLFAPIFDWIDRDQIEMTALFFENAQQIEELEDHTTVTSGYDLPERYITGLSGRQSDWDKGPKVDPEAVYYVVSQYSGSIGYDNYSVYAVPAIPRKDGKGWKKGAIPKRDFQVHVYAIGTAELERIRIVQ
jgi:hypothetical protein